MTPELEAAREKIYKPLWRMNFVPELEALALLVSAIEADARTIAELRDVLRKIPKCSSCEFDGKDGNSGGNMCTGCVIGENWQPIAKED
jgi:hypothetical protein